MLTHLTVAPALRDLAMPKLRVLLVDDHAVVREGLKALVSADPGMEVAGEAVDGLSALAQAAAVDPDVVVMDVSLPGLTGAQTTERLRQLRPTQKVLALTVHEDRAYLRMMIDAGAAGYVLKRAAAGELVQAIRAVSVGETYLDPAFSGAISGNFPRATPAGVAAAPVELSERESAVVRLIAHGYSNKEIANQLDLSVKTVETYKTRSLTKLNVRSRVDLVRYAVQRGWLADV